MQLVPEGTFFSWHCGLCVRVSAQNLGFFPHAPSCMWIMKQCSLYCAPWDPAKPKSLLTDGILRKDFWVWGLKLYLIPLSGISEQPGWMLRIFTLSTCGSSYNFFSQAWNFWGVWLQVCDRHRSWISLQDFGVLWISNRADAALGPNLPKAPASLEGPEGNQTCPGQAYWETKSGENGINVIIKVRTLRNWHDPGVTSKAACSFLSSLKISLYP